jgi:hypothetical protein
MGDSFVPPGVPANIPFSARHVFDPRSIYFRMRASMKPEAKLRGFFHYLAVLHKRDEPSPGAPGRMTSMARSNSPPRVVLSATNPESVLDADVALDLPRGVGNTRRLTIEFQLSNKAVHPPSPVACRALLLTPGVLERLCGSEALRGPAAVRESLARLFAGHSRQDSFEASRILAAVPDLDGEVDATGFCKFAAFELPELACVVDRLPEGTNLAIVLGNG